MCNKKIKGTHRAKQEVKCDHKSDRLGKTIGEGQGTDSRALFSH